MATREAISADTDSGGRTPTQISALKIGGLRMLVRPWGHTERPTSPPTWRERLRRMGLKI